MRGESAAPIDPNPQEGAEGKKVHYKEGKRGDHGCPSSAEKRRRLKRKRKRGKFSKGGERSQLVYAEARSKGEDKGLQAKHRLGFWSECCPILGWRKGGGEYLEKRKERRDAERKKAKEREEFRMGGGKTVAFKESK